jgi:predicted nuclease with TOPRIM domain
MNYKGELITTCKGQCVKFRSHHHSGPSNSPLFRSFIYINGKEVLNHIHQGTKTASEQLLAKKYLDKMKSIDFDNEHKEFRSISSNQSAESGKSNSSEDEYEAVPIEQALIELKNKETEQDISYLKQRIKELETRIEIMEKSNGSIISFMSSSSDNILTATKRLDTIESILQPLFHKK